MMSKGAVEDNKHVYFQYADKQQSAKCTKAKPLSREVLAAVLSGLGVSAPCGITEVEDDYCVIEVGDELTPGHHYAITPQLPEAGLLEHSDSEELYLEDAALSPEVVTHAHIERCCTVLNVRFLRVVSKNATFGSAFVQVQRTGVLLGMKITTNGDWVRLLPALADIPHILPALHFVEALPGVYAVLYDWIDHDEAAWHDLHLASRPRRLQLWVQVLEMLCVLHSRKLVYRDLKPDNLLVTKTGKLWVVDMETLAVTGMPVLDRRFSNVTTRKWTWRSPKVDPTFAIVDITSLGALFVYTLSGDATLKSHLVRSSCGGTRVVGVRWPDVLEHLPGVIRSSAEFGIARQMLDGMQSCEIYLAQTRALLDQENIGMAAPPGKIIHTGRSPLTPLSV
eukprot:TRINITY_DN2163_c0_g1_i3.p1 TRINITY_DN2163_c0_g1~~TRINITY_DN2163_c0_g1_i3.p1  ORF type:complete len:394 (+),score=63.03 TRINITY_DN2163_c0_g1_i3:172-1353(+)